MSNEGGTGLLSLGNAKISNSFSPPQRMVLPLAQRHTSLEGRKIECVQNPFPSLKTRLARVNTSFVRTLIYKLVRNANQDAQGDHKLEMALVLKWLQCTLGEKLGNYFFQMAFPKEPSPVNLSHIASRVGMPNKPRPTTAEGGNPECLPSLLIPPSANISLFTREDEK